MLIETVLTLKHLNRIHIVTPVADESPVASERAMLAPRAPFHQPMAERATFEQAESGAVPIVGFCHASAGADVPYSG